LKARRVIASLLGVLASWTGSTSLSAIAAVGSTSATATYTYDANSNLTKANNPTGYAVPDETFSYDALGNRTSDRKNPSGSITYDAANRRVHDATFSYSYNREGDLTAKTNTATGAKTSYTWTPDHLLTSVTTTGTSNDGTTNYRYDALGRRIQATTADVKVTTWVYDGTTIHGVYQGSGDNTNAAVQATYSTDLAGALLSTKAQASGNLTYPITDNTGSITSQTNTTGQTVATTQYGAFGDPHATSGTDTGAGNAYTFTGHAYDTGTDLVYARARYYDPTVGTFLSEDPLGSINNYTYALNQPTNLVDPTGAEVAMEYGEIANTETDAGVAASTLPSDTILVRGGLNTAEHFVGGSGVTADFGGILEGVSVNSGSSVEEAASGLLNNQVHVSTVGDVLDAGGTVVRAPTTANPGHCLIGGCSADTFVDIFSQVPNPAK
jgi:RHS repeat-associated protein